MRRTQEMPDSPGIAKQIVSRWTPSRLRALRHGLILAGALVTASSLLTQILWGWKADAWDYWATGLGALYHGYNVGDHSYAYSPAFAQAILPLTWLPWPLFCCVWLALSLAALAWLTVPVPRPWRLPFVLLALSEPINGNIHLLIAVAVALGLRYPATWAFVLLTKVTPGVGLLWFAVRREWRALAAALAATAILVCASYLTVPDLWSRWIATLLANRNTPGVTWLPQIPLVVRLPAAAILVGWGARSQRPWSIAVGATLAVPHFWLQSLTILTAIPRLNAENAAAGHS